MIRKPRLAFSLIELLVVMALLSVLAALSAGAYFRVRASQMVSATEATLQKLNTGLDRIWSATRDQADKEFATGQLIGNASKDSLLNFAGGANEKDRARAIWLYMRIKNEFPQTFPEAISYTTLATTPTSPVFTLPPKRTFLAGVLTQTQPGQLANYNNLNQAQVAALAASFAPPDANTANLQAAALLYMALAEKGNRGEVFDIAPLNAVTVDVPIGTAGNFRVFLDSWGTPITYVRYLYNAEIDDLPYARSSGPQLFGNPNSLPPGQSNDPFDVAARFTATNWTNFSTFCTAAGAITQITQASRQEQLLRRNFMPTVISAGANRTWDGLDVRGLSTSPYSNVGIVQYGVTAGTDGDDNLYGYRLRKFGARGD